MLFGRKVIVDENLIAEITGLLMDGIKFYRDRKFFDAAVIKFLKTDEELLKVLMEYITIDKRFSRVFGYHFTFLNNFCHQVRVSIPFYSSSSLNESFKLHRKGPSKFFVLHEGLLLLILNILKICLFPRPLLVCPIEIILKLVILVRRRIGK